MSQIVNRVSYWAVRIAAGSVILLALLVGVARLLLPEASRFADDIRLAVREATHFELDFELLSAGVSLYGPELRLSGVQVHWPDGEALLSAKEVAVAINLSTLILSRELAPALIHVEGLSLNIEVTESGDLILQGHPWADYLQNRNAGSELASLRVTLEDIDLSFRDYKRGIQRVNGRVRDLLADFDGNDIEIEADIRPDAELGQRLNFSGRVPLEMLRDPAQLADDRSWHVSLRAEDFRLDPWLRLAELVNTPFIDSEGTAEAAIEFVGRLPVVVSTQFDISQLVLAQPQAEPAVYERLSGAVVWQRQRDGWQATGEGVELARDGRSWPLSDGLLRYERSPSGAASYSGNASFIRLDDLMPLLRAFGGEQLSERGITGEFAGDIWGLNGSATVQDDALLSYNVQADFQNVGYVQQQPQLLVRGVSGQLKADTDGGTLTLATRDAELGWDKLFREVLAVSAAEGLALWRIGSDGVRVIANDLHLETPDGSGTASLEFFTDTDFANPIIDLKAEASMPDATQAVKYLPNTLPPKVLEWVGQAVESGRSSGTTFNLQGPLRAFPFREDEGRFYIDIGFEAVRLAYAPDWPAIENASGHLIFDNESLYSVENTASVAGMSFNNVEGRIDDLRDTVVTLQAAGPVAVDRLVAFLQKSPIAKRLSSVFQDVRATGNGEVRGQLTLPIRDMSGWQLQGELDVADTNAWLTSIEPRLSDIAGRVRIDNTYISATDLSGRLLGQPVIMQVEPNRAADASFSHRAALNGTFPYARIESVLGLPRLGKLTGQVVIKGAAMFPAPRDNSPPFRLLVQSDLEGLASSLPHPLKKQSSEREDFAAEIRFPAEGTIATRLNLARGLQADLEFSDAAGRWQVGRGLVRMGIDTDRELGARGIVVNAYIDRLVLDEWATAFTDPATGPGAAGAQGADRWQDLFERAELMVDDLQILGFSFRDTDVRAEFGADAWDVELAGPWLAGRMRVPFDLDASTTIEADLDRLLLIESVEGVEGSDDEAVSPIGMPGFRGTAQEFALGTLRLGALEADIRTTPQGLEGRDLQMVSPTFSIAASGDWQVVDDAQRSRLHLELQSKDVEETLRQLGFAPLLGGEYGRLITDLIWEGGPGMAAVNASTGAVNMLVQDGAIYDVDSASGRILGLLSVASLPRRLALDFTDLTGDQLNFDKISGDFRVDFGDAWTCNLAMEGDIADMAIVGRTGLNAEDYDQLAVVRPHVSNLVPVPAAFLGGPTLGVAALLVSQIFKKPLSGIGESYYTIRGSWDESQVRPAQRSELDTRPFADCEQQLPNLSPEERAAIEDLISQMQNPPPDANAPLNTPTDKTEEVTTE